MLPITKPTTASFAVKSAAWNRKEISSWPSACTGSKSAEMIDHSDGIVMSSTVNGFVQPVER